MSKLTQTIILIILLLSIGIGGFIMGTRFKLFEHKETVDSKILFNSIEKVTKLITLEANVSELYTYKDFNTYDWSFLRKKALLRVSAKASIGYDFKKMEIGINANTKQVTIKKFPPLEILSIDHDLDYYDLEEGFFNSFAVEDYNKINAEAKSKIKKSLDNSEIYKQAEGQKQELIEMLKIMLAGMDYELVINNETSIKN